jgi:hypothetical protein
MHDETDLSANSDPLPVRDDHRVEEGGWQKPVAPPKAESRPTGLPTASAKPPAGDIKPAKESSNG